MHKVGCAREWHLEIQAGVGKKFGNGVSFVEGASENNVYRKAQRAFPFPLEPAKFVVRIDPGCIPLILGHTHSYLC